ncbi:MAG: hypothetical protein LAO51_12155 [Acidobacteriia bacterium]|nr:hypothetical protein [Terriglobia bacterium]
MTGVSIESGGRGGRLPVILAAGVLLLASAHAAFAVPAFARKYGTSCLTCHTVFPKLNPFGEAFRRNGYRFPGVDSDFVKQETIALGQEANKKEFPNAVWPGTLPTSIPLAIGFNGSATAHPKKDTGGALADNNARVRLDSLVGEGQLWAAGSLDDLITFFGELVVADGGADIEHATIHFNDLFGAKHAANFVLGKNVPTLSAFGPHSSYVADTAMTPLSVTGLYGAQSDSWNTVTPYGGLELNGTARGRFLYSVGWSSGANSSARSPQDYYASAGYKFGGVRLDGENGSVVPDPKKPWAERALTLNAFYYRSKSLFVASDAEDEVDDEAKTVGFGVRGQLDAFEANLGAYEERHDRAFPGATAVRGTACYGEFSYVAYPWLVPVLRAEYLRLRPDNGSAVSDTRLIAGVAALVRPNLKFVLSAWLEKAKGAPDGGWGPAGGMAVPAGPTLSTGTELEGVTVVMAFAL